ncbi:T9SS type A sorting domain-containing protein [Winogradskyella thalassocola]|uniref:Por secretion system C-terminal sorting domain-containing protein n=1 Tax=Winogradskyella thalassocola TaxID=262004 RepID=A0A1G8B179_9FLAO|nr:T9SS type A sorting domain-containing protein [Winogradskyella thalassocola]SDH26947.1 Por secretion system C-terminal sorting domain-containing protein [Winogradskyella thalassocola]
MKLKLLFILFFIAAYSFAQPSATQIDNKGTGLNVIEIQSNEFTIAPNPAKNKLNIKLQNTSEDLKLEVFDVLGKRIYKGLITKLESSIDVSNWKSGVYLVRISDDTETQTKRFIKQ